VGASEGSYDEGRGGDRGRTAVIAYGRRRWPDAALWLAASPSAAAVAVHAAAKGGPQRLIGVAPGITTLALTDAAPTGLSVAHRAGRRR